MRRACPATSAFVQDRPPAIRSPGRRGKRVLRQWSSTAFLSDRWRSAPCSPSSSMSPSTRTFLPPRRRDHRRTPPSPHSSRRHWRCSFRRPAAAACSRGPSRIVCAPALRRAELGQRAQGAMSGPRPQSATTASAAVALATMCRPRTCRFRSNDVVAMRRRGRRSWRPRPPALRCDSRPLVDSHR